MAPSTSAFALALDVASRNSCTPDTVVGGKMVSGPRPAEGEGQLSTQDRSDGNEEADAVEEQPSLNE